MFCLWRDNFCWSFWRLNHSGGNSLQTLDSFLVCMCFFPNVTGDPLTWSAKWSIRLVIHNKFSQQQLGHTPSLIIRRYLVIADPTSSNNHQSNMELRKIPQRFIATLQTSKSRDVQGIDTLDLDMPCWTLHRRALHDHRVGPARSFVVRRPSSESGTESESGRVFVVRGDLSGWEKSGGTMAWGWWNLPTKAAFLPQDWHDISAQNHLVSNLSCRWKHKPLSWKV